MSKRWCRLRLCPGLVLLAVLFWSEAVQPAERETGFLKRVFKGPDGKESRYMLFVPPDTRPDQTMPVIVFLHGSSAVGNDGEKQSQVGLPLAIRQDEKNFPFLVVLPQAQLKSWRADGEDGKRVLAILDEVAKSFKIDPGRIYLTGQSMGGSGTWSLAAAYPERWAAIVPICGRADPTTAARIKKIPCWCFHGDADALVPVDQSRKMIKALEKAGGMPRYTEYAGVGHNSWSRAYATRELFDWLLQQQK